LKTGVLARVPWVRIPPPPPKRTHRVFSASTSKGDLLLEQRSELIVVAFSRSALCWGALQRHGGLVLIHPVSVSQTVDAIQSAVFEKREIPARERAQAGKWLAARQGLPGAYADTFAGFDAERAEGIVVFTGERVTSASARHILGEETCRALRLLELRDRAVKDAL
jgi:hypothetical protein